MHFDRNPLRFFSWLTALFLSLTILCSKGVAAIAVGGRVSVTQNGVNIRSSAAGTAVGTQSSGALGTVTGGPTTASLSGTSYVWWNVNFDSGTDGWIARDFLQEVVVNAPTATTQAATNITSTSARMNGTINPNGASTTAYFQYGATTSYGSSSGSGNFGSGTSSVAINTDLSGASPSTTFHYRVVATNSGGTTYGSDRSFTTSAPPQAAPSATTQAATNVTSNSARMNATINPKGASTSAFFQYGTTTSYGGTTGSTNFGNGSSAIDIFANNSGLNFNTTFHYRVVATNSGGTTYGGDATFTTYPAPVAPAILAPGSTSSPGPVLGTLTPIFNWNSVNGATGYGLYIRDTTTDLLIYNNEGGVKSGTSFTLPAGYLSNNGHSYRWAMSSFANGYESTQGSYRYFQAPPIAVYTLSIGSSNPNSGVYIYVGPNDNQGLADGTTSFTRQYNSGTSVTLIAPTIANGNSFVKWTRNGIDFDSSRTTTLTMSGDHAMTAVFAAAPPVTHTVTVASSNPNSGVSIGSNTLDNNSNAGGTTSFTRIFNKNATATYVAPTAAGGNVFQKWQRDGVDLTTSTTASITVDANRTLTAVYGAPSSLTLAVSSPNGGEAWTPGSTQTVGWAITGTSSNIAYFKLALSTDGGASWPTTNSDSRQLTPNGIFDPTARNWSWVISASLNNPSLRIRVRALDIGGNILAEDTSNANFAVTPSTAAPTVALSSPDGGETWTAGGTGPINWSVGGDAARISSFRIDYSLNGGALWTAITSAVPSGTTRSYLWNVPSTLTSTQARIRVRALDSGGIQIASDASAANFTISAAGANPVARLDCNNNAPISGQSVRFDGSRSSPAASIVSYSWNFGDGQPAASGPVANHVFNASVQTTFTVFLTVTDNLGRSNTGTLSVAVNGNSVGATNQSSLFADPVNLATGNFTYEHTDLRIPAPGIPFEFKRVYNSKESRPSPTPLGYGWNHSYNVRLQPADPLGTRTIVFGDSRAERYEAVAGGGFAAEAGIFSTLAVDGGGHVLTTKTQTIYRFDGQGRLTLIVDKNGNTTALTYGASGTLDTVTDSAGRSVQFGYGASQRLVTLTDALARVVRFAYDAAGDLVAVTDANGGVEQYEYDADHQMTAAIDPEGNQYVTNEYDPNQRIVALQKDALGNQTLFAYDFVTRLTTVTDPLLNKSYHLHDEKLRVIAVENALGHVEAYEYDGANNRTKVIDRKGQITSYGYDSKGNVTSKIDALSHPTLIEYDARNNPEKRTDALGGITTFGYDAKGNPLTTTDATGAATSISYNPAGLPLTQVNPRGHARTFAYDAAGNLTQTIDALGNTTRFTYDAVGRKLTEQDALNRTATFVYDPNDNLLTLTDPAGTVISTYDANNNRLTTRDRRGNTTTFDYDAKERLVSTTDALNRTVSTTYDAMDRKIAVTDARENTTQFAYDPAGNLIKVTDPLGKFTEFGYDANGNRISVKNPLGNTTSFTYDPLNRIVETQDPLLNKTRTEYDALGRRTKTIDAMNRSTTFLYDALGRLLRVTDANGGIVTYAYDAAGNRLSMIDPNNQTTTYTYDVLNRLVQTKDPSNGIHENGYDTVGNLVSRKDAKGQTTTYACDTSNRRTGVTYPAGTPVTFSYDANGNRIGMTDSLGTSSYTFDVLNRVTSETDAFGNTVGYSYDPSGNRLSIIYPGAKTVGYTYDANNRMKTVTDWLTNVTSYSYDDAGNLKNTVNPNGTTAAYNYDTAGRLIGLANAKADSTVISNYLLTLDAVGNHTQSTQNEPLLPVIAPESINYTYDSDNRLTNAGATALSYDTNGNLTSRSADTYTYDFENRLTQNMIGGATSHFQYDAIGNRKSVITSAGIKRFVLNTSNSLSHMLAETDGAGTVSAYYVYGLGLLSQIAANGVVIHYHYDVRGSSVALTDAAAIVTDAYAYDPFGKTAATQGATANPFKYVGKYGVMDEGSGLTYIRARYFSPEFGRFITKDPMTGSDGDSQSLNRYVYALNSPIRLVDISGYFAKSVQSLVGTLVSSDRVHNMLLADKVEPPQIMNSLIGNTKQTLGMWGLEGAITSAGGFVAAHTNIDPTKLGNAAGSLNTLVHLASLGKQVVFDPWRNAYRDTYDHPERSLTEAMARYFTDVAVNAGSGALQLFLEQSGVHGSGIVLDTVTETYRTQIQGSVLSNPVTDWYGTQIHGAFGGTGFLGL